MRVVSSARKLSTIEGRHKEQNLFWRGILGYKDTYPKSVLGSGPGEMLNLEMIFFSMIFNDTYRTVIYATSFHVIKIDKKFAEFPCSNIADILIVTL